METTYCYNVVIDLEFTQVPKKRRINGLATEIIEVGAVKIAQNGSVTEEFSQVVKPTMAPGVSGTVHRMTGIGDEDLTCAKPLAEVLEALSSWVGEGRARFVTWSDTDHKQVNRECEAKGIEVELPTRWLDIQRLYPRLMGMRHDRLVRLGDAADWCGISNDKSSAHRALYDAQMTAEIFLMMASGECAEHRARLDAEMNKPGEASSFTFSIADHCDGLAELLANLMAQETVAA